MSFDSRNYRPSFYGGFNLFPSVIKYIIISSVVMFLIQAIFERIVIDGMPGNIFLNLYFALNSLDPRANFQVWQLITYQFMHGDFWHLFWNMFILWMFGKEICEILGERKFLMFYLLSGIGGGLVNLFLASDGFFTIGASAAVYGVMIAFGMFFPNRLIYVYFIIPVRTKYLIGFMIIMDFLMINKGSSVAHLAHLGGALTGAIIILLDKRNSFNVDKLFNLFKSSNKKQNQNAFRRPFNYNEPKVEEAKFYDINDVNAPKESIPQEEIDRILDKISESGYQNLTTEEKRILFEASKNK